jgi:general transcription factor 3C polypeptide 3 (transcription factor C subunit 4)
MHLAIPEYERCLALAESVREEAREKRRQEESDDDGGEGQDEEEDVDPEEFTQEAAFALMHILAMNSNEKAAKKIADKYLVL